MITIKRGSYLVIRVDGSEQRVEAPPTSDGIREALNCETFDSVVLERIEYDVETTVMMVDDTIERKHPINEKATAIVRAAFGRAYPVIYGDVVIADDRDFIP